MIVVSLILTLIAGALVGGAMVLADKVGFYLIVLVPIIGGTIIGYAASLPYLGRKSKARTVSSGLGAGLSSGVIVDDRPSRLPLIVVALLGVVVATAVYWGGYYFVLQEDNIALIQAEDPSFTREDSLELINFYYESEYGTTGFMGHVQDMAASGISINRATSSSDSGGINLTGNLVYAYWALEIVLMAGFAIATTLRRARAVEEPEVATAAA